MKLSIDVEVKAGGVVEAVGRKSGKSYCKQTLWVDMGKAYPQEVSILLDRSGDHWEEFAPGRYVLDESALFVNRNGDLQVSFKRMKRVTTAKVA